MLSTRHGWAVLLLGGWLLMQAPVVARDKGTPDETWTASTSAAIKTWDHVSAFDTAERCERGKDELQEAAADSIRRFGHDSARHAALDAAIGARCVPAEHVYPPAKP